MYTCTCCNYSTEKHANYIRHLESSKHKRKFESISESMSKTNDNDLLLTMICKMEEKINALSINNKQLKDRVSVLENALENKQPINLSTSASGNVTVNNGVIINNHHTSVNIQVKDFGNESIEHIGPKDSCKVLNSPNMALRSLMELIHFNPEAPEYHNILWTNMQKPIISIKSSDGVNGWSLVNKNDTLEELAKNLSNYLDEMEDSYGDNITPKNRERLSAHKDFINMVINSPDTDLSNESKKEKKKLLCALGVHLHQLSKAQKTKT